MKKQWKAIAGAVSGALVAFVPVLVGTLSGSDLTPDQINNLGEMMNALVTTVGSALVGWFMVYFAPKNSES